jgi:hypothetical protein
MQTIRLDVSNDIYDKVMAFIENLPKNKVKLQLEKKEKLSDKEESNSLVEFFQSSPLVGEVSLERDEEAYKGRVAF